MITINTKIADAAIQHQVDLLRVEAGLRRDVLALMETLSGDLAGMLAKSGAWDGETIPRKLKRLQGLKGQADGLIGDLYGKLEAETTTEMRDGAKYAAEWVPATINAAVGANVAGITLTTEVVTNLVKNTLVEGAPSAQWWGRQSETLKMDFMREMRMGILQGENLSDLTRRIRGRQEHGYADGLLPPKKDEFGKITRQASTRATRAAEGLALTSVQQVMADARMEAYRQNSELIKGVQQLSTLDGRTSLVCRTYDHAAWDLEGKPLPGFPDLLFNGGPPYHFRCRSILCPITRSWAELGAKGVKEFPPGTRASMDGQVADTLDYSTWLKSKPEAFQREVLGKGRYELWRDGKAELKDMVDQRGRPVRVRELAGYPVPPQKTKGETVSPGFSTWVDKVLAERRPTGELRKAGEFIPPVLSFLETKDIRPGDAIIWMDDRGVLHTRRDAKVTRGAALSAEEIKRIPEVLMSPERVLWDTLDPALLYIFSGEDKKNKIVVDVWQEYRKQGVINRISRAGRVKESNLGDIRYEEVPLKGKE